MNKLLTNKTNNVTKLLVTEKYNTIMKVADREQ